MSKSADLLFNTELGEVFQKYPVTTRHGAEARKVQKKLAPDDVYIVVVLETHPAEGDYKVTREDCDNLEEEGVVYRWAAHR